MKNLQSRKTIVAHLAVAGIATLGFATPALADFPEKPITIMVGFGAGGGTDTLARLVAKNAEAALGQPIVVENVPGGGGIVAATKLMNADPDGYTIGMAVTSTFSYAPQASDTVKYNVGNFDYVTSVAGLQNCVVASKDAPFNTWEDVVRLSKEGKKLSFGTPSPSASLAIDYANRESGIEMKMVPVKGGAQIMKDVMGSHLDMGWSAGIHQKFGDQLKVIVTTDSARLKSAPDVQTLRELGIEVGSKNYFMMFAPKGIPADRLEKLINALSTAARSDDVKSLAEDKMGFPIEVVTGEDLRAHVQESEADYKRLIDLSKAAK
jgi:tripartite-type tricarboxylate transporter receptor subunit TctC